MFTFLKTIVANTKEYFGESLQETFVKDDFPIHMKAEFLKMILSLGGLLLALTLGIWTFKKLVRPKSSSLISSSAIKILDRRNISQKSVIYLIEIGNKILVLGESNDNISILSEFPPNTDLELLIQKHTKNNSTKLSSASDLFQKVMNKIQKKTTEKV